MHPERFLQDCVHIETDRDKAIANYNNMPDDSDLNNKTYGGLLFNGPKVKNEIVWNYQNKSGMCNLSAMMYAQYIDFCIRHLNNLNEGTFEQSQFPEVNKALYYGQTALAVKMFKKLALDKDNNESAIPYNHYYTHFNVLGDMEPRLNYTVNSVTDTISTYTCKNKEKAFRQFIANNTGYFKVREHGHACFLYLSDTKAIYVNNSLLSIYPLVCNKNELVDYWKQIPRWDRDNDFNYSTPLFNVIQGFQRIKLNESDTPLILGGGKNNKTILVVVIAVISVLALIIAFIICLYQVNHSRNHLEPFQ